MRLFRINKMLTKKKRPAEKRSQEYYTTNLSSLLILDLASNLSIETAHVNEIRAFARDHHTNHVHPRFIG